MGPSYVYILSRYQEDGAEDVKATLNREHLPALLESYGDWVHEDTRKGLANLLEMSDASLAARYGNDKGSHGHSLEHGWGGFQLHVVELA